MNSPRPHPPTRARAPSSSKAAGSDPLQPEAQPKPGGRCATGLAALALCLSPAAAGAEVVINELSAAQSERLLRWGENGVAQVGAGTPWFELGFDDSAWKTGRAPIGYGPGAATDVGEEMRNVTPSLYLRRIFTATAAQASAGDRVNLRVDYNDGFVAYLNGVEIARRNLGAEHGPVYRDQTAYNNRMGSGMEDIALGSASSLILEGENILAVQLHNQDLTSPALINPSLRAGRSILEGGSGAFTAIAPSADWRYMAGRVEPSGGLFDPALVARPGSDAGFSDWVELHNRGAEIAELTGWSLSDDAGAPSKWTFPEGTAIDPGGYLIVLLDEAEDAGSDATYLHASFKLSSGGEFLGLFDPAGEAADTVGDEFPPQDAFHSYGRAPDDPGAFAYLATPTPGAPNAGPALAGAVEEVTFSAPGGFHAATISVELGTATAGATIRYTLDGSEPGADHGDVYTDPIRVGRVSGRIGTAVRARAFKDGWVSSPTASRTFLVGLDTPLQSIPAVCLVGDDARTFYRPHGVTAIRGGTYVSSRWQATAPGDYFVPLQRGRPWERPASLELIYPDGREGFQIDMGVRVAGSNWSRPRYRLVDTAAVPWQSRPEEKPSFNFYFRGDYGRDVLEFPLIPGSRVDEHEMLRLRAGKNDISNPFIRDEFMRRVYIDTGQVGSVGIQNTLFINGEFKGYFNLTERLREPFFQRWHNSDAEWDVRQVNDYASGDVEAWNAMFTLLNRNLSDLDNYAAVEEVLDVENVIDYLAVNIYGATWDWPHNNWVGARERAPGGKYRLYMWDAEGIFGLYGNHPVTYNTVTQDLNGSSGIAGLYTRLRTSPEFRLHFADRLQKHFAPGGALSEANMRARMVELRDELDPVMRYVTGQGVNTSWFESWLSRRYDVLFGRSGHLPAAGLWPETGPPRLSHSGGRVPAGTRLSITKGSILQPEPGEIYYTTDGSDPRLRGGAISAAATHYTGSITLETSGLVRARALNGDDWSPLIEAHYLVGTAASAQNLVVAKLNYRPAAPGEEEVAAGFARRSDFEFVELLNTGENEIDLTGVAFTDGINFTFDAASAITRLAPGARVVIVRDPEAFAFRHGEGHPVAGAFSGGRLNDDGERIEILDAEGAPLLAFTYNDRAPWPEAADGDGHALVLVDPTAGGDLGEGGRWRISAEPGGSPGSDDRARFATWLDARFSPAERADPGISGPRADPDGDGRPNLLEFFLGEAAEEPIEGARRAASATLARHLVGGGENDVEETFLTLTFPLRLGADELAYEVEVSADGLTWVSGAGTETIAVAGPDPQGDGTGLLTVRDATPAAEGRQRFIRLRVAVRDEP